MSARKIARPRSPTPTAPARPPPRRSADRTLHDATRKLAAREGKTPVFCLCDRERPGFLVCVHSDELVEILEACRLALEEDGRRAIEAQPGDDEGFRMTRNDAR